MPIHFPPQVHICNMLYYMCTLLRPSYYSMVCMCKYGHLYICKSVCVYILHIFKLYAWRDVFIHIALLGAQRSGQINLRVPLVVVFYMTRLWSLGFDSAVIVPRIYGEVFAKCGIRSVNKNIKFITCFLSYKGCSWFPWKCVWRPRRNNALQCDECKIAF